MGIKVGADVSIGEKRYARYKDYK